jgi:hypothetical protein
MTSAEELPEFPIFDDGLSSEDQSQITAALASDSRVRFKNVLWASLRSDGIVDLRTGQYFGPKAAHGDAVTLQRAENGWQISSVSWYIA